VLPEAEEAKREVRELKKEVEPIIVKETEPEIVDNEKGGLRGEAYGLGGRNPEKSLGRSARANTRGEPCKALAKRQAFLARRLLKFWSGCKRTALVLRRANPVIIGVLPKKAEMYLTTSLRAGPNQPFETDASMIRFAPHSGAAQGQRWALEKRPW
jgi:hypothetical protein